MSYPYPILTHPNWKDLATNPPQSSLSFPPTGSRRGRLGLQRASGGINQLQEAVDRRGDDHGRGGRVGGGLGRGTGTRQVR